MPNIYSDSEFERKNELRKCREDRDVIIRKIGYSDECNPFGDSFLSAPFIWVKRFEREKNEKYNEFQENCRKYRWYKFGVLPIDIDEITEIRKRREIIDENLVRRRPRVNSFNYDTWLENEQKFEKLRIQSSSIIRIKEHRENMFDIIFWKVLIYSFFCKYDSLEDTENVSLLSHSLLSLTLVGISGSLSHLISIGEKRLLPWIDHLINKPDLNKNENFIELTKTLKQHKKMVGKSTEIEIVDEWLDILDGLEIMTNLDSDYNSHNLLVNNEIKEIIKNKNLDELKLIITESQKLSDEEYWNNVVLNTKVTISRFNIEKIENIYNEKIESWATELSNKYNIDLKALKVEDLYEFKSEKVTDLSEKDFYEDETSDQLVNLPFIEFSIPTHSTIKANKEHSELQLPIVHSKIKTRYVWNQYNRNYYDEKSLPPKMIQGYRFKIIFPLLNRPENRNIIPKWYLTTREKYLENNDISIDGDNKTTSEILECEGEISQKSKLLIFSCNQCKYKDIGFSIIDKEWETNPKNGYRSCFENATLYLNFNFKQKKYKR